MLCKRLRIFFPLPTDRVFALHRLLPGTGTLPDAEGAGGGGYAHRIPPGKVVHTY